MGQLLIRYRKINSPEKIREKSFPISLPRSDRQDLSDAEVVEIALDGVSYFRDAGRTLQSSHAESELDENS